MKEINSSVAFSDLKKRRAAFDKIQNVFIEGGSYLFFRILWALAAAFILGGITFRVLAYLFHFTIPDSLLWGFGLSILIGAIGIIIILFYHPYCQGQNYFYALLLKYDPLDKPAFQDLQTSIAEGSTGTSIVSLWLEAEESAFERTFKEQFPSGYLDSTGKLSYKRKFIDRDS